MKGFVKYYLGLVVLILGLGLSLQSCSNPANALAEQMSAACPRDIGGGVILNKVTVEGNYLVRTFTVPEDTNLEAVAAADKAVSAEALKASDKDFVDFLSANDMGVKDVYSNSQGTASLVLEPKLFK